jgi:hypothetical protein
VGGALLLALACSLAACGDLMPVASREPPPPPPSATPSSSPSPSPSGAPAHRSTPTPRPPTAPPTARPPLVAPGWVGPIYAPGQRGYDVSYPQCPAAGGPSGAAFSIIGVNGGRGFTTNPCLGAQWRAARGLRAVYLNSGYDSDNADRTTADCRARSENQEGSDARRLAYAIGCSEAVFAVNVMKAAGADRAAMVWLDVESSNSWDPADLDLNRTALQAEIDQLAAFGRLVGLYATFSEWRGIMGDWSPNGVVADWLAGTPALIGCGVPGFSGHPVWIIQELITWPGTGQDLDRTC